QRGRQSQLFESRDIVGDDAHDNGATSALFENVHAKTTHAREPIRKVSGSILFQLARRCLVLAHDVVGDKHRVLRSEALQTLELEFLELSAHLDLGGATWRED